LIVREFQSIIGKETKQQAKEKWGSNPDILVACVGGGSLIRTSHTTAATPRESIRNSPTTVSP